MIFECPRKWKVISFYFVRFRFNSRLVRSLASAAFVLRNVTAMGITLYTPCVALNTILGVPYYASLLAMTGISICFTLLVHIQFY